MRRRGDGRGATPLPASKASATGPTTPASLTPPGSTPPVIAPELEYARRHIRQLYEISKLLARFESVKLTIPAVLSLATGVLHVRIAILVEGMEGRPVTSVWRASSVKRAELEDAMGQARRSYTYLAGSPSEEEWDLGAEPGLEDTGGDELDAMSGQEKAGRERRWTIPLAVDHHSVFGVLFAQCRDSLDEVDLAFLSSVANQIAVALDRHYARKREVGLRKQAEDLARSALEANARAQEAVRARDAFISVASHELKNPLGTLSLQVGLILKKLAADPDPDLTSRLESAMRQIKRMARLLDNLLDVSRVTAGRLDLELEDVDLALVAKTVVERSAHELEESGCLLTLAADRPVVGRWDASRLDQVITNLVSNAMKYGTGEPIAVTVDGSDGVARLVVTDHGIGVKPEDQERIFERFERAADDKHSFAGLGLGLWIVRQIVEAMSGTIRVTSQRGEGSTFTVELPFKPALERRAAR